MAAKHEKLRAKEISKPTSTTLALDIKCIQNKPNTFLNCAINGTTTSRNNPIPNRKDQMGSTTSQTTPITLQLNHISL